MKALSLETALAWGGVALMDTKTGAAYSRVLGLEGRLSAELFPAVEELFREAGWRPGDVELIACSSGPGSFTGLRVGMAAVKGWYAAARCAVKTVPTFDVMAATLPPRAFPAVGLSDARARRAYYAVYREPASRPEPRVAPLDELADVVGGTLTVFGPDAAFIEGALAGVGVSGADLLETPPDALVLLRLAVERYLSEGGDDAETLKPIYLTTGQV
jgi:tRNA threonylcarbamoyladenosine biosynthesis protein TsaB